MGGKAILQVRVSSSVSNSRIRLGRCRGVIIPIYLVSAILGIVAGILLIGVVTLPTFSTWQTGSSGASLSAADCSKIESSSNLTAGINNLYYGNGNKTGLGSGLINQSPPGPSAYPPESTAVANVVNGWNSICTSHPFYVLEQRWGAKNATWSGLDQNQTGIYEYVFTIDWQATATQCTPFYGYCMGSAEWLVNVASGSISAHNTTFVSPQPGI
jgi:hypothetical protein